ncbi:unnamed protein product [Protopolystoma xenopodis]|uniref:Uncharacterized protein n=1 Tax=Protopolystoma xenopodis TaxID=117903 RepID=A0A3S4ZWW0_9PLAT|nr:unnamed protein product [Protopolystoma xenopodis]
MSNSLFWLLSLLSKVCHANSPRSLLVEVACIERLIGWADQELNEPTHGDIAFGLTFNYDFSDDASLLVKH